MIAMAAAFGVAACATAPVEKETATTKAPPPPEPVYTLDDILGLTGDAVNALLGPPTLVRREGQGEYRRYGLSTCALIIILYPDDKGAAKARHVDATALTSGQEKPDLKACLAAG